MRLMYITSHLFIKNWHVCVFARVFIQWLTLRTKLQREREFWLYRLFLDMAIWSVICNAPAVGFCFSSLKYQNSLEPYVH